MTTAQTSKRNKNKDKAPKNQTSLFWNRLAGENSEKPASYGATISSKEREKAMEGGKKENTETPHAALL